MPNNNSDNTTEEKKKRTRKTKETDGKTSKSKTSSRAKSGTRKNQSSGSKSASSKSSSSKSSSSKSSSSKSSSTGRKKSTSTGRKKSTGTSRKKTSASSKKTAPAIEVEEKEVQQEIVFEELEKPAEVKAEAETETIDTEPTAAVDTEAAAEEAPVAEQAETEEKPAAAADHKFGINYVKLCGVLFIVLLVATFAVNIILKDKLYSDQENRVFQQFPEFSVGNYLSGRYESQLDNYANDQFMFRNAFIKIKSAADLSIGQLKANNVFKCSDSYLMEDITYPDKDSNAADIAALKAFKKKYSGKKMYFMLVPNAANLLSSKLPSGVVTHDQNADMDKLFGAVEALGYTPIDVRDELKKASRNTQIYYRTDHHWTTDVAYIAYKKAAEVMKLKSDIKYKPFVVKNDFVGTLYSKSGFTNGRNDPIKIYLPDDKKALNSVIRYTDTKEKTTNYYDMENLKKKDAYTVFGGTNHSLFSITTPVKKNRNLLVIKDSYANCFIPFLTQDYRTITIVDPRYYYENIATVIKANDIDEVLFLYNANTYFSDNYMRMMLTNK